ncbi:putative membrane protein [Clostridioides difficile DA00149]|nr:putative membrane protein [Clostridioides difficile DA00149]
MGGITMEKGIKLGFWSIVLLGINAIIGSGIFGLLVMLIQI